MFLSGSETELAPGSAPPREAQALDPSALQGPAPCKPGEVHPLLGAFLCLATPRGKGPWLACHLSICPVLRAHRLAHMLFQKQLGANALWGMGVLSSPNQDTRKVKSGAHLHSGDLPGPSRFLLIVLQIITYPLVA